MLTADHISKEFFRLNKKKGTNCFSAVQETYFELVHNSLTVISGRSGSGKSTLLNMLCGLSVPTKGRVLLDNTNIYTFPDADLSRLRNIEFGIVPQGQTALHSLTVLQNILMPFSLYHEKPDLQYAEELMKQLDITVLRDAKPAELSGGELRRVAIARAVIRKPQYIFADEPTSDLDDENTATVFRFFRSVADSGAAVLIVTHELDAWKYADRVYNMHSGILTYEQKKEP